MMFGDREGFLCVYVGRISNEKRIDLIFAAIQALKGKSTAYLAIIGDGPNASFWAKRHGKENRVYCKPRFLTHLELAEVKTPAPVIDCTYLLLCCLFSRSMHAVTFMSLHLSLRR
jgi:glycosyltransferase involved in cell wall biosynthesis